MSFEISDSAMEAMATATERFSPIVKWGKREFFPGVSKREWEDSRQFVQNNGRRIWRNDRNSNPAWIKEQDVPQEVMNRTIAAEDGDRSIWDPDANGWRWRWWNDVVSGRRNSDWVPQGPGGRWGMWVE